MSSGIDATVIGNLVDDPELRFTTSGKAVANLTIANTPRYLADGEWHDGETTFVRCNVWDTYAENVAESFHKGQHVIAYGRIAQRKWEDKDGNTRYNWEMTIQDIGHTLRFGTTDFEKTVGNRETPPPPEEKNAPAKRKATAKRTALASRPRKERDNDAPWENDDDE